MDQFELIRQTCNPNHKPRLEVSSYLQEQVSNILLLLYFFLLCSFILKVYRYLVNDHVVVDQFELIRQTCNPNHKPHLEVSSYLQQQVSNIF